MKQVLNEIVDTLESIATNVAAMEATLYENRQLQTNVLNQHRLEERMAQKVILANLRHLIASLRDA